MSFNVVFIKEAKRDISIAAIYYFDVGGINLYNKFFDSLLSGEDKLKQNPQFFSYIEKPFRSLKLKGFPYLLIYSIEKELVVVYQVFHAAQNPDKLLFNTPRQ